MKQPDNNWEGRMSPEEVAWVWDQFSLHPLANEPCRDNFRAARVWKSSDMRRFRRMESSGCCGSVSWVAKRWNWKKLRRDVFLLGFNFGH